VTSDEFFRGLCGLIKQKTGIEAIRSHQQAKHPNAGREAPIGQPVTALRKYVLVSPGTQRPHKIHKYPDPDDINKQKKIDMIPTELTFTVSGIECKSDELRPVWWAFIREDFKTSLSEDWSILHTGNIMHSPIYDKGEWKQRWVFECRALIYDTWKDENQFPIESIGGAGKIFEVTGREVAQEIDFRAERE